MGIYYNDHACGCETGYTTFDFPRGHPFIENCCAKHKDWNKHELFEHLFPQTDKLAEDEEKLCARTGMTRERLAEIRE